MKTIAYVRVSTDGQDYQNQKIEILSWANAQGTKIDKWTEMKISSRKSMEERKINSLLAVLEAGDVLVVSELSRLGRSISQIIQIVDELIKKGVRFIAIKQGMDLNGKHDITSKTMVTMFALMAEIERDLISERTKMGLAAAKAKGKVLGRKPGTKSSKLDQHEDEIRRMYESGVGQASLARLHGVSAPSMAHFLESRGIKKKAGK